MKEIVKTMYVADDGKEFEDEKNCREYEFDYYYWISGIVFYKEDGSLIDELFVSDSDPQNTYNTVTHITIDRTKDKANKKFIKKAVNEYEWVLLEELLKEPYFRKYQLNISSLEGIE